MVTNEEIRKQMHDLKATIHKTSDLEFSFFLSVSVTDIDEEVFGSDWFGRDGERKLHSALVDALKKTLKGQKVTTTFDISQLESNLEDEEEEFDHLDDSVTAEITYVDENR